MALNRPPMKGDKIVYQEPGRPETRKIYVVMGRYMGRPEILSIRPLNEHTKDGDGHAEHTQIIWTHPDGPNPWLEYVEEKPCDRNCSEWRVCAYHGLTKECVYNESEAFAKYKGGEADGITVHA